MVTGFCPPPQFVILSEAKDLLLIPATILGYALAATSIGVVSNEIPGPMLELR